MNIKFAPLLNMLKLSEAICCRQDPVCTQELKITLFAKMISYMPNLVKIQLAKYSPNSQQAIRDKIKKVGQKTYYVQTDLQSGHDMAVNGICYHIPCMNSFKSSYKGINILLLWLINWRLHYAMINMAFLTFSGRSIQLNI